MVIATIGKPRGLRGECHVYAQGRTLESLKCPARVETGAAEGPTRPMVVVEVKAVSGGLVCRFEGVESREQAEALTNGAILVDREQLPKLGEGEFYHFELEGMRVCDGERELGVVKHVENYPTTDALEVAWHTGRNVLVPLSTGVLRRIDRASGRIDVDSAALEDVG